MGSIFSKYKDRSKPPKPKKNRKGRNNPHNFGSTQSVNTDYSAIHSSPNPNHYSQPENTQRLPRHHSSESLPGEPNPRGPPRTKPPPIPGDQRENRIINAHSQFQNFEDFHGEANPSIPPRLNPPPKPGKETESRRKDTREDRNEYLKEKIAYYSMETTINFETSMAACLKELNNKMPINKPESDNYYDSPDSNSKPKVRADRNYEANYESDISFRKGDILQLINDGEVDGWYFVKNLSNGQEGYVHKDWVTILTSADVESQKYYFKSLNRNEAEEKLLEPDLELGTYLLRPTGDGYALSLRCESELYELEIRHYKILVVAKGICYIDADSINKPFSNILELIKYYTEKPGLRCRLITPLPQDIPLDDLTVKLSDLEIGEKLGSGNFGSVYAGTLHKNKQVAVKSLRDGGSMTVEEFRKEAETMHKLRHPNLVSLLAICKGNGKIYIITERMSKGAMLDLLRKDTGHTITFKDLMHMAIQVVDGMCYLEKKGFVHRDLRAANVLVGDGNITKIADFGLARLLDSYYEHEDYYQSKKGTVFPVKWTAPEAIKQQRFSVKSDVWSFGILLYEMVTHGDEPYAAMSNHDSLYWVEKGNRLKKPTEQHCPVTLYNIMRQCWSKNSEDRPNFADIKETLIEIKTNA